MSEKSEQLCANCPKRNLMSQIAARLALQANSTESCAGYVHESHGKVVTQLRGMGEPAPADDTWTSLTISSDMKERWYTRLEWENAKTCGVKAIEPREGEVDYSLGQEHIAQDGHKSVAYISGDKQGVAAAMFVRAMQNIDE